MTFPEIVIENGGFALTHLDSKNSFCFRAAKLVQHGK